MQYDSIEYAGILRFDLDERQSSFSAANLRRRASISMAYQLNHLLTPHINLLCDSGFKTRHTQLLQVLKVKFIDRDA